MHPRSALSLQHGPVPIQPSAVTHAHAARKLLQRAVFHLRHAEHADRSAPPDDSKLIQQALERLAVADLLIDAYTTPPLPPAPAHRPGGEPGPD